jgi:thiol-disulfide isomerase/thioredoxin
MTRISLLLSAIIIGLFSNSEISDKEILNKTISKLQAIETIEYQSIFHYVQKDLNMDQFDTSICFLDYRSKDTLLGVKYHFVSKSSEQVFNGTQSFICENKEERIIFNNKPTKEMIGSSAHIMFSLYEIKKFLPVFMKDTSIKIARQTDTIINSEDNYRFEILLKDKFINYGSVLTEVKNAKYVYKLFISKKSFLPTQYNLLFPENKGFVGHSFSKNNLSASRADSIWSYERFPRNYLRLSDKEYFDGMRKGISDKIGKSAPEWTLPMIAGDSVKLSELKGKLVLLEFWFQGCGACVQSIPKTNDIQKKYAMKGLKVYGIEFVQENDKGLVEYIKKHDIEYPTLFMGKKIAREYSVIAAPAFFLINKKGKIVYSSFGLNLEELNMAINNNI